MAKHLKQQQAHASPIMARLLLCLFACAAASGCLLPQDDQVLPDLPPFKNRPPRVVARSPDTVTVPFKQSSACATQNPPFSLIITDPDTGDTLRSFWFIDRSKDSQPYRTRTIPPTASEQRNVEAPTASTFTTALANLTPDTHLITVVISDREIEEIIDANIRPESELVMLPDGRFATDTGYAVEYTWVLAVTSCP